MPKKNVKKIEMTKEQKDQLEKEKTKSELEDKLDKMKLDRTNKISAARKQLVEMLEVTADKYRTATGTAEALRVLRFCYGRENDLLIQAIDLSKHMAIEAKEMAEQAEKLEASQMDKLCEEFYAKDFTSSIPDDLAFEMMRIDLCRNVGGAAEDMVSFIARSNEEIEATEKALKELTDAEL